MKNFVVATLFVLGFAGISTAGDCANGVCSAPVRPVRKVVEITKNVVVAPVRLATRNNCSCETTSTVCENTSKEVCKYQPLRRRLVHRTTNVTTSCCE